MSSIPFGPLFHIASRTVTPQSDPGQQHRLPRLLDQIRERHRTGIMMVVVASFDDRKDSGRSRQQHIGIAGKLASTQMNPLMHRSRLVHVVTLIGPAAGIEKEKISGNQQRCPVMRHGIGSGKNRTGLSVIAMAVGKEQGVFCRETVLDQHPFTDKTLFDHRARIDPRRSRNNKIGSGHPRSHIGWSLSRTNDRAVP